MKRLSAFFQLHFYIAIGILCFVFCMSGSAEAKGWRFPVGLTVVTGYGDVVDLYENNLEAAGYSAEDSWHVPVGVAFQPYYEFDSGFRIGTGFGPMSYLLTSGADDDPYFFTFPINANLGFTLFPDSSAAPYIRAGVMYHLAAGDYVDGSSPGVFGAVGIELMRDRKVSLGIEVGFDASEIDFEKYDDQDPSEVTIEDIRPYRAMISLFAAF